MKKFICFLLVVLMIAPSALASQSRVFDNARLFSDEEGARIKERIVAFREKQKVDYVVLTTNDWFASNQQNLIAQTCYDSIGAGVGDEKNGFMYYIDDYEGVHVLLPQGSFLKEDVFTNDDIQRIQRQMTTLFAEGKFYDGVICGIDEVDALIDQYWDELLSAL